MPHSATAVLTIANGGTDSGRLGDYWRNATGENSQGGRVGLEHASAINIQTPAALTGVVSVQVAHKRNPATGDFSTLKNDDGTDVTLTAARSQVIDVPACTDLRLVSSLAEAAERTFRVAIQENI